LSTNKGAIYELTVPCNYSAKDYTFAAKSVGIHKNGFADAQMTKI